MNFKFNLQGVDVQINEDSSAKVEKLEIEYTDVKLSEIPEIITAFKGLFAEINQQMNPSSSDFVLQRTEETFSPSDVTSDSSEDPVEYR